MLETGLVGTIALIALFVTAITLARNVRHTAPDDYTKELGQAFVAGLVGILVCFATFDTLSFPMIAFLSMTIIGLSGALWRINRCERGQESFAFYDAKETENTNDRDELVSQ
jgi:O-antigen ligase